MNSTSVKTPFSQTILLGTRWGMMVGLTCDPYQTASLGFYGEWAMDECGVICSFLKPGDVALDIGANIGSIAVPMGKRVGPDGMIMAFEPQRAAYYCLCANIALTHLIKSVRAFNSAVSDHDGVISVPVVDVDKPYNVGGVRLEDAVYDEKTRLPKEEVPCMRIDSMGLERLDFVKIDVETMEHKVLAGASDTIAKLRPVIMAEALNGEFSSNEDTNMARMKEFFAFHKYDTRIITTGLFSPNNVRYCTDCIFPGTDRNLIAIPAERTKPDWFDAINEQ